MEEKLLILMEKMNKEFTDIKTKMATKEDLTKIETKMATKEDLAKIETKIATKEDLAKVETKMENEVIDKVRALYDNREIQTEINDKVLTALNRIETKIDTLQIETAHIRRIK